MDNNNILEDESRARTVRLSEFALIGDYRTLVAYLREGGAVKLVRVSNEDGPQSFSLDAAEMAQLCEQWTAYEAFIVERTAREQAEREERKRIVKDATERLATVDLFLYADVDTCSVQKLYAGPYSQMVDIIHFIPYEMLPKLVDSILQTPHVYRAIAQSIDASHEDVFNGDVLACYSVPLDK